MVFLPNLSFLLKQNLPSYKSYAPDKVPPIRIIENSIVFSAVPVLVYHKQRYLNYR